MGDHFSDLLKKYRTRGVLIDANLLLVYFVGGHDPALVTKFKRTKAYTVDDYHLLAAVINFFGKVVTTPNILTEVNGLSNQLPDSIKPSYYSEFADRISVMNEQYVESQQISRTIHFAKFGLTDSGIVESAKGKYLIVTDDLRLAAYCQNIGADAINFNNLRTVFWTL